MNLKQYVTENPADDLTAVQNYSITTGEKLSADLMRSFLNHPQVQLYSYFKSASTDAEPTNIGDDLYNVGDLKMTTFDNMAGVGEFNFITGHPSDQTGLIDVLIFAEPDTDLKARLGTLKTICLGYCNAPKAPFADITLVQLNQAKGIYTQKEVVGYTPGKNIKITLIDALPENCAATTWAKEPEFDYENNGKIAHLKTNNSVYKLRMDNKNVDGKLFVRIPLENFDFTVEAI